MDGLSGEATCRPVLLAADRLPQVAFHGMWGGQGGYHGYGNDAPTLPSPTLGGGGRVGQRGRAESVEAI